MQVEYAPALVFAAAQALADLDAPLTRTAIHAVKAQHVATFLGHKLTAAFRGELGTDCTTRVRGTRIKHHMGPAALKLDDKFGRGVRIETTAKNVEFFKHPRQVVQKDGRRVMTLAPVRKSIYSLAPDLRALLHAANLRYVAFLSELVDPRAGVAALRKACEPVAQHGRMYRGLNFFAAGDQHRFEQLVRGEFLISGLRNNALRTLTGRTTAQISHVLKRLRVHGLIKTIAHTYKYYFTDLGRRVILAGLTLKTLVLIPALAEHRAAA